MTARKLVIPEKQIEASILGWLKAKKICAVKIFNGGSYNQKRGKFIFSSSRTPGVSDIIVAYKGIAIAIEVKSEAGRQSPDQKAFEALWTNAGGYYTVARSIEDVENFLNQINDEVTK